MLMGIVNISDAHKGSAGKGKRDDAEKNIKYAFELTFEFSRETSSPPSRSLTCASSSLSVVACIIHTGTKLLLIVVAVRGSSFSVVAGKIVGKAAVVIVVVIVVAVLVVVVLVVVDAVIRVVVVAVLISVVVVGFLVAGVVTSIATTLLIDGVDISMSNKDSVSSFGGGPEVVLARSSRSIVSNNEGSSSVSETFASSGVSLSPGFAATLVFSSDRIGSAIRLSGFGAMSASPSEMIGPGNGSVCAGPEAMIAPGFGATLISPVDTVGPESGLESNGPEDIIPSGFGAMPASPC